MKKVLVISDLTLENIIKQIKSSDYAFEVRFTEDVATELIHIISGNVHVDCLYIHCDNYFKFYTDKYVSQLIDLIERVSSLINTVLFSNFLFLKKTYSILSGHQNTTFQFEHTAATEKLLSRKNVFFIDHVLGVLQIGLNETYNFSLGFLYQMPYKKKFIEYYNSTLTETLDKIFREEKKVIVVDCDNTLWNGIVGEDGVENIKCDTTPDGIIYLQFQKFLKSKLAEGFILCICSKNNLIDVKDAFDQKSFPLQLNDFTIKKINWNDKIKNLAEIADELNLAFNSVIFIDDSEFEIESVQVSLPDITCFRIRNTIQSFHALISSFHFKRKFVTFEDAEKSKMYTIELSRKEEQKSTLSIEDYIKKLNIKLDIRKNDYQSLERLSQMTGKTNQFNFNKISYSVNELKQFIEKNGTVYSCSASDIHGDYGIIGLAIVTSEKNNGDVSLHNLLLSCRALGRGIENSFYDFILEDLNAMNKKIISIQFKKTDRNQPAEEFYKQIKMI